MAEPREAGVRYHPQCGVPAGLPSDRWRAQVPGTRWCRAAESPVPGRHGTFDDCIAAPAGDRRARLRRAVLCRRSIRSGASTARAATMRWSPRRTIPAAPMRSGRRKEDTTRSIPSSGRSTISVAWLRACHDHGSGGRARLRDPVLARPSLGARTSRLVQAAARRVDPLRGKPAEEIRGHRQPGLLLCPTATRYGRRCATWFCSGSTRASRIFRVDNPHTKPLPFWEWLIGEVQDRRSRRRVPVGGVHASQGDEGAGQAGLHAVLHLLHVAHWQGGAPAPISTS